MLFNSYPFILVFLPVALAGTFWIGRRSHRGALAWLAAVSLAFYAAWDARFVLLLLASIAGNYSVATRMDAAANPSERKAWLVAAIAANLVLLAYFKYTNFFVATIAAALGTPPASLAIILPLGISFYTFTQIAFLVDVHRGLVHERSFLRYLLFVTYFPHLIAGPLLHHRQVMPQFAGPAVAIVDWGNLSAGATIFVIGLAKKVLLADPLGGYASPVFEAAGLGTPVMLVEAWMGALAYTLQLYFDFSGYCDMAIGLSLMLNVRLPLNFDSPYKAASIIDFWRRWHMSLSAFLRDYVYIPLGGNRTGPARRYLNVMVTMVLGGLWHGAGWTFIAWGALHGAYLLVNHGWRAWRAWRARHAGQGGGRLGTVCAIGLTFVAVVVGWVVFRADSLATAGRMLAGMIGLNGLSLPAGAQQLSFLANVPGWIVFEGLAPAGNVWGRQALPAVAVGLAIVWLFPNVRQIFAAARPTWEDISGSPAAQTPITDSGPRWLAWKPRAAYAVAAGVLFVLALFHIGARPASEFLYYQF